MRIDLSRHTGWPIVFGGELLRGVKPADLPIEQVTRFELIVNRRAARTLGLTLPQALLLRADEVFD